MDKYEPFDVARRRAKETERKVKIALADYGCRVSQSDDKEGRDFSVEFPEKAFVPLRVEVKDETNYKESGNLFVETSQGRPRRSSGLMVSQADVTVHVLGDGLALYLTKCMRELIFSRLALPERYRLISCGDNHNEGMLVRLPEMRERQWFALCSWQDFCASPIWRRTSCGDLNEHTAPVPWTAPGRSSGDKETGWLFPEIVSGGDPS